MKKFYITYADCNFRKQGFTSVVLARLTNYFDEVRCYKYTDIDENFESKYNDVLSQEKGGGYWLWKPYIISQKLDEMSHDDILLYADAGAHLIRSPKKLIEFFINQNQDIAAFQLPLIERQWTKGKCLDVITNGNTNASAQTNQIQASFILIKKTDRSLSFIAEYLHFCKKRELLLDDNMHDPSYDDFIEHRHDQSIFSLLYKKHGLAPFEDVSHRGLNPATYALSNYSGRSADDVLRRSNNRYFKISSDKLSFYWRVPFFLFARKQKFIVCFILFVVRYTGFRLGIYKGLVC